MLGTLREAGFSIEMAVHAYSALDNYIYGFVLQEKRLPFGTQEAQTKVVESILR